MIHIIIAASMALPVPHAGRACGMGYVQSGGFCAPTASARYSVPRVGVCPPGYVASGGQCVAANAATPIAVPRSGTCPAGYFAAGAYCRGSR